MGNDSKPHSLHVLPGSGDEILAAVETARRAIPVFSGIAGELARARMAHYKASIEAGFTKEQALVLCMKVML